MPIAHTAPLSYGIKIHGLHVYRHQLCEGSDVILVNKVLSNSSPRAAYSSSLYFAFLSKSSKSISMNTIFSVKLKPKFVKRDNKMLDLFALYNTLH